eukprot:scaffold47705_cov28-Tisochrysis_lutea.AAC.2
MRTSLCESASLGPLRSPQHRPLAGAGSGTAQSQSPAALSYNEPARGPRARCVRRVDRRRRGDADCTHLCPRGDPRILQVGLLAGELVVSIPHVEVELEAGDALHAGAATAKGGARGTERREERERGERRGEHRRGRGGQGGRGETEGGSRWAARLGASLSPCAQQGDRRLRISLFSSLFLSSMSHNMSLPSLSLSGLLRLLPPGGLSLSLSLFSLLLFCLSGEEQERSNSRSRSTRTLQERSLEKKKMEDGCSEDFYVVLILKRKDQANQWEAREAEAGRRTKADSGRTYI